MKLLEDMNEEELVVQLSAAFRDIRNKRTEVESRKKNLLEAQQKLEGLIVVRNLIRHFLEGFERKRKKEEEQ